jgi:hypothetical protein
MMVSLVPVRSRGRSKESWFDTKIISTRLRLTFVDAEDLLREMEETVQFCLP